MAVKNVKLLGDLKELFGFMREMLQKAHFIIMKEEDLGDGFRISVVNRKRTSLMTTTLLSLIGGYVPRNRVGLELTARDIGECLTVSIKCTSYLDNLDLELPDRKQEDRETCENLAEAFMSKITERFDQV